jgi:hypothetical protein
MKARSLSAGLAAAGVFAGALAWATHQQAGYVLAAFACGRGGPSIWAVSLLTVGILAGGGLCSILALRRQRPAEPPAEAGEGRTLRFLATIGLMAASLFFFAIALQASAVLFLAPCAS